MYVVYSLPFRIKEKRENEAMCSSASCTTVLYMWSIDGSRICRVFSRATFVVLGQIPTAQAQHSTAQAVTWQQLWRHYCAGRASPSMAAIHMSK
jgi:hypothetical protein